MRRNAVILFYDDESKWSMAAHVQSGATPGGCVARAVAAADPGRPSGFVRFNVSAGGPDG